MLQIKRAESGNYVASDGETTIIAKDMEALKGIVRKTFGEEAYTELLKAYGLQDEIADRLLEEDKDKYPEDFLAQYNSLSDEEKTLLESLKPVYALFDAKALAYELYNKYNKPEDILSIPLRIVILREAELNNLVTLKRSSSVLLAVYDGASVGLYNVYINREANFELGSVVIVNGAKSVVIGVSSSKLEGIVDINVSDIGFIQETDKQKLKDIYGKLTVNYEGLLRSTSAQSVVVYVGIYSSMRLGKNSVSIELTDVAKKTDARVRVWLHAGNLKRFFNITEVNADIEKLFAGRVFVVLGVPKLVTFNNVNIIDITPINVMVK